MRSGSPPPRVHRTQPLNPLAGHPLPVPTPVYMEFDGRVFVVEEEGIKRLPSPDEVPFPYDAQDEIHLPSGEITKAKPMLERRPTDWPWKDDLPGREDVDPLVQEAIHRTMPRMVAKVAYLRGDEVLLVKPRVGFFAGTWNLPGGYVDHGEHPERSVRRETREEVGVRGDVVKLCGVDSSLLAGKGLHFVMFLYQGTLQGEEFSPEPEEIEEVRWFPLQKALDVMPPSMTRRLLVEAVEQERFEP